MNIATSLFEAQEFRLAQFDHEKDPPIESRWTHDSAYTRMIELNAVRPLSPAAVKKAYEELDKEINERCLFHFAMRARSDDRLIGFAQVRWVEWSSGNGYLRLGIGDPADRQHGWGSQALGLLLRYAFAELNLFRVSALVQEYNRPAIGLFRKFAFVEEVCRRQALRRDGRSWDLLHYGLLRSEWEAGQK
jgi:RimJ/RimL family protein N-acetyltransferase